MKSTGIVRKVDELGRVTLPKELRRTLGINEEDPMEIFTDGDRIILRKYEPGCLLCGSMHELRERNGKNICQHCLAEMTELPFARN